MPDHTTQPDDELANRLARALAEADPVPDAVHQGALDAFAFRDLDAALAELVVEEFTTVRDPADGPLVFATGDTEITISLSSSLSGSVGHGQLTPAGPWPGRAESPSKSAVSFRADDLGRFQVDLPGGVVRLVIDTPLGPVRTSWFHS